MLLNTTHLKSLIRTVIFFILFISTTSAYVKAQDAHEIQNDIKKTLRAFNYSESESAIFEKLDAFLLKDYGYTNREYLDSLTELGMDLSEAVKAMNSCIEEATDYENQFSREWINDLLRQFDKEYIHKNESSIQIILYALWVRAYYASCKEIEKEVIHKEMLYMEIRANYVKYFLEFAETLDDKEKDIFKNRIAYAQYVNTLPDKSLKQLLAGNGIRVALSSRAVKTRKDVDPKLAAFFSHHPFFSKPFDRLRAIKEIRKIK